MFKVGDKVEHFNYGKGEITLIEKKTQSVWVSFETEQEIVIYDVIDEQYHFEDNTRIETTNFIRVFEAELTNGSSSIGNKDKKNAYINHCHSCKKLISSQTHPYCVKCRWLKCECDSCKCNYKSAQEASKL
jgi:ABC-type ATPase with predicted acetyltransferase domain